MINFKMKNFDPDVAALIYDTASVGDKLLYGYYGVMLVHWFFPSSIEDLDRKLAPILCKSPECSGDK